LQKYPALRRGHRLRPAREVRGCQVRKKGPPRIAYRPIVTASLTSRSHLSQLRQVPDNQEVYIDKDGFTSIIIEITERVGPAGTGPEIDGRALTTHLEEVVGSDVDTVKVWNTTETEFSNLG
jgi:hypothetical protein